MSHTFATLEVSPATYNEIADAFRRASYDHAFVQTGGKTVIDMHGVALTKGPIPALLDCVNAFLDCVAEFPNDPSIWGEHLNALQQVAEEANRG